jgi:hypothetical protein
MIALRAALASLLLCLSLSGCLSAAERQQREQWRDRPDAFTYESTSWGRLVIGWRIDRTGAGSYRFVRPMSGGFYNFDIVTRHFQAGTEGFDRVRLLLNHVHGRLNCDNGVTDAGDGMLIREVGTQRGQSQIYFGCSSSRIGRAIGLIDQASSLIEGWSNGAAEEIEQFRQSETQ